jgi:spore germination protein GerM
MTVHRRRARRGRALVLAVAAGLAGPSALASCGVPGEDGAHVIPDDAVPFGLAETPSTTQPDAGPDLTVTTGTEVELYFPSDQGFVAVRRDLTRPLSLAAVIDALATEPVDTQSGFRSAVGPDDVRSVQVRGGVATLELDRSFLDLPNAEQQVAVAQLVLTLTAQPGVGQIRFVIDDEPAPVPRADGTVSEGAVSRDDFVELIGPARPTEASRSGSA